MYKAENKMSHLIERANRRQAILSGIKQNLNNRELAAQLGVKRSVITADIKAMRFNRDTDLREAKRISQANADSEKNSISKKRDEKFYDMTGMTFHEQSFKNMVNFYKPELMKILRSSDHENAIRNLPKSTRKTLIKNGILKKRKKTVIVQKARDQLL
jgi:hypothetical protein